MKRMIFSIFSDNIEKDHQSSNDYKKQQFTKYAHLLEEKQKEYARICGAEYNLFKVDTERYDQIQFDKIHMFDELVYNYDEVLYLDFDVIPQKEDNFFEHHDLDAVCAYSFERKPSSRVIERKIREDDFDGMNVFSKGCCKQSMLLLHDISSDYSIINTGVLGMNRRSVANLNFTDDIVEAWTTYFECRNDNIYPEEINKYWRGNNEVFITYMIEKNKVKFNNIGMPWNFMLDEYEPNPSDAAYLLHYVHKDFKFVESK